jgi:hypothetical protein
MSTLGKLAGKTVGLVVMGALAAALGLGAFAYVQSTEAASPAAVEAHLGGGGRGGFCGEAGQTAAAEALGLTVEELQTELWGGATLSSLAASAGVELEAVQAAVNEACQAEVQTNIEQAVADGTITQAHADWLLEGLEQGFWGPGSTTGRGFGIGGFGGEFGPRGGGGHRGGQFGQPAVTATATP